MKSKNLIPTFESHMIQNLRVIHGNDTVKIFDGGDVVHRVKKEENMTPTEKIEDIEWFVGKDLKCVVNILAASTYDESHTIITMEKLLPIDYSEKFLEWAANTAYEYIPDIRWEAWMSLEERKIVDSLKIGSSNAMVISWDSHGKNIMKHPKSGEYKIIDFWDS